NKLIGPIRRQAQNSSRSVIAADLTFASTRCRQVVSVSKRLAHDRSIEGFCDSVKNNQPNGRDGDRLIQTKCVKNGGSESAGRISKPPPGRHFPERARL